MSEKRPIEPSDIKAGDRIRFEYTKPTPGGNTAHEYVSARDAHAYLLATGQHYLLERPKTLLYPAGTDLWLTEDHYPWNAGDKTTLAEDWYEGGTLGVTTQLRPNGTHNVVGLDSVTDKRPEPAVELPTEPTLGWATNSELSGPRIGEWYLDAGGRRLRFHGSQWGWNVKNVTAFTPAVAIPAAALDELRNRYDDDIASPVHNFLAAIDGATS